MYNFCMKRVLYLVIILLYCSAAVNASNTEISKQATAFYADNNHTKATDLILQIDDCERSAQDWILLGNILADKGENENAAYMYQKAIAKDKKAYKAYYNLGNYYFDKGQLVLAIDFYKKALKYKKDNPYIYFNLACIYIKQNDLRNARVNLNKAISIKSDVAEFHYNLAYVYKKMNNTKLAEIYLQNYNQLTGS